MAIIVKKSKKPSKQRKIFYSTPIHSKKKILCAHLSEDLKMKYGIKSLPLRKGDVVLVMRGDARRMEGKITKVDRKKYKVYIEGITRKKQNGDTVMIPIHYSKVKIMNLDTSDARRKNKLDALVMSKEANTQ